MPSDIAKAYDEVIKKRLHELVHSNIPEDESGGLAAIGKCPQSINPVERETYAFG